LIQRSGLGHLDRQLMTRFDFIEVDEGDIGARYQMTIPESFVTEYRALTASF
jgi:hypothetical protein